MARRGSVLVVAILLLAACSSGADEVAQTTTSAPTTPSSTDAPTTTIAPTTTDAPTTTLDPAAELAAEVEADLLEGLTAARTASMDPFDRAAEDAALDHRVGFARTNLEEQLATWREQNYAIRDNPAVPASVTVEKSAQLVLDSDDVAEIQVCEIDSWILVEIGAGPEGSEAIVNPDVVSYRTNFFLRLVDGVWKIEAGNELAKWEGATSCERG